jgi:phosphocarrier protein
MAEVSREVTIINELGLHARAASKLVQLASKYPVEIEIGRDEMMVNSKSIMGVLMLAAGQGSRLQLVARGEEGTCGDALDALCGLIDERFGEER